MLLSAMHLKKKHNDKKILDDVSFAIEEQDKIALIGVNGTGKTTLLNILVQKETLDQGEIIQKNGLRIAYLSQDPVFDESKTILQQLLDDPKVKDFEAKAMLSRFGIQDYDHSMQGLSGGQRKRIALAKTLLMPSDLLLLDEPTNHLDHDMIVWLEKYLQKMNKALLMVTHDRYFLDRVTNRIYELDQSKLYVHEGNYADYLQWKTMREEIETAMERKRQSILRKELVWVRSGVQARGTKSKERLQRFEELSNKERKEKTGTLTLDTLTSRLGKKIIEIDGICKQYGDQVLFRDFTYHVAKHDRIGILGPNGCGKSTLLHILNKEIEPDSGTVVHGETVKIAYFKQGFEEMDPQMRVIDYIREQSNAIQTLEGEFSATQMLERFLFNNKTQYQKIGMLSGGEKRRLYLLKVLMQAPNVLFLDEPTNDLDLQTLAVFEDYLDQFDGVVICVSHDRYLLDRICDKVFVFEKDRTLKSYIGGYSAAIELMKADTLIKKEEKTEKIVAKKNHSLPKMSSKEKKELEEMEQKVEQVQNQIDQIDEQMQTINDYELIGSLSEQRAALEEEMELLMERWVELSEKKAEIDALKR